MVPKTKICFAKQLWLAPPTRHVTISVFVFYRVERSCNNHFSFSVKTKQPKHVLTNNHFSPKLQKHPHLTNVAYSHWFSSKHLEDLYYTLYIPRILLLLLKQSRNQNCHNTTQHTIELLSFSFSFYFNFLFLSLFCVTLFLFFWGVSVSGTLWGFQTSKEKKMSCFRFKAKSRGKIESNHSSRSEDHSNTSSAGIFFLLLPMDLHWLIFSHAFFPEKIFTLSKKMNFLMWVCLRLIKDCFFTFGFWKKWNSWCGSLMSFEYGWKFWLFIYWLYSFSGFF